MRSAEQKYWLSSHVHVCVTDNYAVLLDLRRDKYIGVAREHVPALGRLVVGWPVMSHSEHQHAQPPASLLNKMLDTGMLTTDPALGREAQPPSIPRPQFPAIEADLERRPHITIRNVFQVLIAAATAKTLLKRRSIEDVVTRVQRRKERHASTDFDLDAARPLVEAFLYLRPLFFTTKDECLFDSLVLVELLARNRMFPAWLFGVTTSPFKAHSWVQAGDRVLNDQPERVSQFAPILVV